jgi:hypothetical protein
MKAFKVLVINRRISSGINKADRMENASRNKATLLTNTSTQYEQLPYEAEAADTPCRPVESILMPIEKSHPHENFFVRRESRCCEMAPARTLDGSIRYVRPTGKKKLSEASAHEGARLNFVRSGMQMFRDAANGALLRRDWLLHQETREHSGGGFVEPLFEEGINFLFQIGRMVQSGKFK